MPNYKQFKQVNPEYDNLYWRQLNALYSGGKCLTKDIKLLKTIMPQKHGEEDSVYRDRLNRAFCIPYLGSIIDYLVSACNLDPISVSHFPEEGTDPFYDNFVMDTSKPGGSKKPLLSLLQETIKDALLLGKSWLLIDLPKQTQELTSLYQQEQSGMLNLYACHIDPENVLDYEYDDDGNLVWALLGFCKIVRAGLESDRNTIVETYIYYTDTEWKQYQISYTDDKPPKDEDEVALVDEGYHSFGKVPVLCLDFTETLWIGDKLYSLCKEHFNQLNALSWAKYRSLFSFYVAKLAPVTAMNPTSENTDRAITQPIGPGRMMVLTSGDEIETLSPDSSSFDMAAKDLTALRDEIYRVFYAMSLSFDNSAGNVRRTAESKQADQASISIILKAIGNKVRTFVDHIFQLLKDGRQDNDNVEFTAVGMDSFDVTSNDIAIQEALTVKELAIPSKLFNQKYQMKLVNKLLTGNVESDELKEIEEELMEAKEEVELPETKPEVETEDPAKE